MVNHQMSVLSYVRNYGYEIDGFRNKTRNLKPLTSPNFSQIITLTKVQI